MKHSLNLKEKHFPLHHKNGYIYRGMPNIKSFVNKRNKNALYPSVKLEQQTCNCANKMDCPSNQQGVTYKILNQETFARKGDIQQEEI